MKYWDLEIFLRTWQVFLAAGAFVVTPQRKARVNFTLPISIQTSTLLTARPGMVGRALIFMDPFTYDVSSRDLANSCTGPYSAASAAVVIIIIIITRV
jgi:hypothetical protein